MLENENLLEIPQKYFRGKLALFHQEYPEVQYKFMFKKLKESIEKQEKMCKLYRIKDTSIVVIVPEDQYLLTLDQIMTTFIDTEAYELAQECKELINHYAVTELIRTSQGDYKQQ